METRIRAWAVTRIDAMLLSLGRVCWFYENMFVWFDSHLFYIPTHNKAAMERSEEEGKKNCI